MRMRMRESMGMGMRMWKRGGKGVGSALEF